MTETHSDVKSGRGWGEGVPVKYGVEDDGEGWYDCDRCGLVVGLQGLEDAKAEAVSHDCEWNLLEDA